MKQEDQVLTEDFDSANRVQIPVMVLVSSIWRGRRLVLKAAATGLVLAAIYAFSLRNQYQATASLLPPDAQTLSSPSLISATGPSLASALYGGNLSGRTAGATVLGIVASRATQDVLIQRFDLKHEYKCRLKEDARKILTARTTLGEDKKSGILMLGVEDPDPIKARDLVQGYIDELNERVINLSTSSARRERIFLEQRLKGIKADLDASVLALSNFSSHNATINLSQQGQATVEEAVRLQSELIAAKSELSGLTSVYTADNVRVKQVQGRIDELSYQLRQIGGEGEKIDSSDLKENQLFPSIRKLPLLGVAYAELQRQVTTQQTLYELLIKQYEFAKVDEAREIPTIKVLDAPDIPERKSGPHRSMIVMAGLVLGGFLSSLWLVCQEIVRLLTKTGHMASFRQKIYDSMPD